jgi:hypothetical protein
MTLIIIIFIMKAIKCPLIKVPLALTVTLSFVMLNVVIPSIIIICDIKLNIIIMSVSMPNVLFTLCCYAECYYDKYHSLSLGHYAKCCFAEYFYAMCRNAEYHYFE